MASKKMKLSFIAVFALFASTQSYALDLGIIGQTYKIAEQDAVEQIKAKLQAMEKTGELEKLKQEAINRSLQSIKSPKHNKNLTTATKQSMKLIDPSQTFNEEIRAEDGTLISPAGRTVNPLDYMQMSRSLIFFDGRDKEQVEAVKQLMLKQGTKFKPILTAGSWFDISKSWKRQVYFDQAGFLAKRFSIEQVPAIVQQQGNRLQVRYIPAKEIN